MSHGPQPMSHSDRLALAKQIAGRFHVHFGEEVRAIGMYGSLARNTDAAYSDIEMYCILNGQGIEKRYEWSAGPWKAEVDVQSADVLVKWASELDEMWSLTHGSCVDILSLHDPENFFATLKEKVFDHNDQEFDAVIKDLIVGELYEFTGKIRNALTTGNTSSLPLQVTNLTKYGAFLVGLANRSLYTSSSSFLSESLTLKDRPNGYDVLCEMLMRGELNDFQRLGLAADHFWNGIEAWAAVHGFKIHEEVDELLK
jgi:kanamycin nucleotidyltransferase